MHRSLLLVLTVALLASACGSPRRRWQPTDNTGPATGGGQAVVASGVVASGSPREQLEQLDGLVRQQGFDAIGPVVHGELPAHGLIAYAIDAVPNACYTVAAIAEGSDQNIDLIVLDPYGRPAAHDVRPDGHPWASFCATQGGRFIARLQMAAGSGGYFYGAYRGPASRRLELSAFYGQTPEQPVEVAQMDAAIQGRLNALDGQLAQRGFSRVGTPAGLSLSSPDPRDFRLNLQQGQCYAFATLGGTGAVDTDVILNDASGQRLQADTTHGPDATIEFCAPATGDYSLQVRMFQGQGALFTVGYVQGQAAPAQAQPVIATDSTAGAGLSENFALLDADMRARGYESYGEQTRAELGAGGTRDFQIQLEGGRCYAILAVGDGGVQDLNLHLLNARGQEVDRDTGSDARPTVRVCPTASGAFTMRVAMTAGYGAYIYAPYRWPRGTTGPFGLEGLSWVRISEVTALLHVEGFEPDPGFTPGHGTLRREGQSATHQVELQGGQCYAVVAVGGEGINDLDITLSQGNTQLASDYGIHNAFPSVRHCVERTATFSFQITAASGHGRYDYQIFSRTGDD